MEPKKNSKKFIKLTEPKTSMINFVIKHPYSFDIKKIHEIYEQNSEQFPRDPRIIICDKPNDRKKKGKGKPFFNQLPAKIKYNSKKGMAKIKIFTKNNINVTCCDNEKCVQKTLKILIDYFKRINVFPDNTINLDNFKIQLDLLNCDSTFKISENHLIDTRKLINVAIQNENLEIELKKNIDERILSKSIHFYLTPKMLLQIILCVPQNKSNLYKMNTAEIKEFFEENKIDKKIISLLCLENNIIGRTLALLDTKFFYVYGIKNKKIVNEFLQLINKHLRRVICLIYNTGFCRMAGAHSYEEITFAVNTLEIMINKHSSEVIYKNIS